MPTWISCPTFSSTDIFFTRFCAKSQDFFDGASGCAVCDGETRRRDTEKVRDSETWRRGDAESDMLGAIKSETAKLPLNTLLVRVVWCVSSVSWLPLTE